MATLADTWLLLTLFTINVFASGKVFVNQEHHLKNDLFENYSTDVRPVKDSRDIMKMMFDLAIHQIIQVNEKEEKLTLSIFFRQYWNDEILNWDPEKYGNLTDIVTRPDNLWVPDITLYNNAEGDDNFGGHVDQTSARAIVSYQGNVTWLSSAIVTGKCTMDIRYFPFDEQHCHLTFGSWAYHGHYLDIDALKPVMDMTAYDRNSEWTLVTAKMVKHVRYFDCCKEPFPTVRALIHLRRKPLFYVLNLLVPMILIGVLTLMAFFLPLESGERISFAVTLMLALTVFMLLVADLIPPSSETIPQLGIFFTVVMIEMVFMLVTMCYTLNLHFRLPEESNRIGKWTRIIIYDFLARKLGVRKDGKAGSSYPMTGYSNKRVYQEDSITANGTAKRDSQCEAAVEETDGEKSRDLSNLNFSSNHVSKQQKNEEEEIEKVIAREFQICANTVDLVALIGFAVVFGLTLIFYFLNTHPTLK